MDVKCYLELINLAERLKNNRYLKELRKQIDADTVSKIEDSKACS